MKKILFPAISAFIVLFFVSIGAYSASATVISTGGDANDGAVPNISSTSTTPTTGGGTNTGTVSNTTSTTTPPATGGTTNSGSVSNTTLTTTPPATGGSTNSGTVSNTTSTTTPPATGGGSNSGTVSNTSSTTTPPLTGGGSNTGSVSNTTTVTTPPPTGGGGNSGAVSTTTTSTTTPPSNGGGGTGILSGGGFSMSSGGSSILPIYTIATSSTSCPLLTSYLKLGGNNDPVQVSKLQAFLKNVEGFTVTVNGTFDQQTEDAVKAFQAKYLTDVMGPWNATRPSGFVYITTRKKINELACETPFTLSPADQAVINAYLSRLNTGSSTSGSNIIGQGTSTNQFGPSAPGIGENTANGSTQNTASVVNAPFVQRFFGSIWGAIVNFFKRIF